ncbi:MAG: hypothetical protein ABL999_20385 [Pyrinomonadaceae bacterium]
MAKVKLTLKQTEDRVPALARSATGSAFRRALAVGSVLVYKNGELRRVEADGENSFVKKLEPRIRIVKGSKFEIKAAEA